MIFREGVLYLHGIDIDTHLSEFYMYSLDHGLVQIEFLYGETNRVDSNYFTVLDNSEDVSFISICANYTMIADMYQSPLDSGQFWLSLPYHRASCNSVRRNYLSSDFHKVSCLSFLSSLFSLSLLLSFPLPLLPSLFSLSPLLSFPLSLLSSLFSLSPILPPFSLYPFSFPLSLFPSLSFPSTSFPVCYLLTMTSGSFNHQEEDFPSSSLSFTQFFLKELPKYLKTYFLLLN